MDSAKAFSKGAFVWIFVVIALLTLAIDSGLYFAFQNAALSADPLAAEAFSSLEMQFTRVIFPATLGGALVFALLLWMIVKGLFARFGAAQVAAPEKEAAPAVDPEQEKRKSQRTFLHLVSALQKEGRLLDFFGEDLSLYSDDQIGAAVRGIHEGCKKTLAKYMSQGPVMEAAEGESITIEEGFNPEEIRLTGDVSGEPPFQGVVRHKGWRAEKVEVPTFSESSDPAILAPAEVELQ